MIALNSVSTTDHWRFQLSRSMQESPAAACKYVGQIRCGGPDLRRIRRCGLNPLDGFRRCNQLSIFQGCSQYSDGQLLHTELLPLGDFSAKALQLSRLQSRLSRTSPYLLVRIFRLALRADAVHCPDRDLLYFARFARH